MNMKLALTGAAIALAMGASQAAAAVYMTGTQTFTGLGDQIGSQFDQITLNGVDGAAFGPGTYTVNSVDFLAGVNSNSDHIVTGSFTDTASVDGSSFFYTVPYQLSVASSDTITLGGGKAFVIDGFKVAINPLTLTSGGEIETADLTATVSAVPEPSTWVLMLAGVGGVGLMMRRARKTPRFTNKGALAA